MDVRKELVCERGKSKAAFCSMMVCVFTCVQSDLKFSFVFIRTL